MTPIPPNQEPASNGGGARKRKVPLDDNGEPVIPVKKKKSGQQPQGGKAATTKPTRTSGKAATKPMPTAGPSRMRAASVEEVLDDEHLVSSAIPRNPRNILEAADGSDDGPIISVKKKKGRSTDTRGKGGTDKNYSHLRKGSYKANAHCWSFPNASSIG